MLRDRVTSIEFTFQNKTSLASGKGEGEDQDAAARAPLELTPSGLRLLNAGITSVCTKPDPNKTNV